MTKETEKEDEEQEDDDQNMDDGSEVGDVSDNEKEEFWNIMQNLSEENHDDILDIFEGYLALYYQSKGDVLYLKIMGDVCELEGSGMDFRQALAVVINKNKEAIKFKITDCKDKSGSETNLNYGVNLLRSVMNGIQVARVFLKKVAIRRDYACIG